MEKKLDGNYTRMIRATLNESWRLHPTKQQLHMDDQLEPTCYSSVPIRDITLMNCEKQWTIGRGGGRGSEISLLIERYDDDILSYLYTHTHTHTYIYIYIIAISQSNIDLSTAAIIHLAKDHLSTATTPRCRGGHSTFPWITSLYPWSLPYSAKQVSIKYHFLSLSHDSTWDWTLVSRIIGHYSTH